jgi:hypothetical protein
MLREERMPLTPVKSSNIAAVDFNPETRDLTMHFTNGSKGIHANVSPQQHVALMGDGTPGHSVGKYYHANIKGRDAHPYKRLDE